MFPHLGYLHINLLHTHSRILPSGACIRKQVQYIQDIFKRSGLTKPKKMPSLISVISTVDIYSLGQYMKGVVSAPDEQTLTLTYEQINP